MIGHLPNAANTHVDVVILGGGVAGLSAAMPLARARRRVLIIDAGQPRNRFATAAHGFQGQDGRPPADINRSARAELAAYPTVSFITATAVDAASTTGGFSLSLTDGTAHTAARLILATGVVDDLPDLPGLRDHWGQGVYHCPYCHGYEIAGTRLGVLPFLPISAHHALLIREWGDVTLFTNGAALPDDAANDALDAAGITVESGAVAAITGEPGHLTGIRLRDGRTMPLDAIFTAVPFRMASPIPAALGCEFTETPFGPIIRVDSTMQTTIPSVFAAGDAARAMSNIPGAVADGFMAGVSTHRSLVFPPHAHA